MNPTPNEAILAKIGLFIDEAAQEMNSEYPKWKALTDVYENASNMDLSPHTVSHAHTIANAVDAVHRQLTLPKYDIRFIDTKENAVIMNVLSRNGLEKIMRGSNMYNAFHGRNGIFFNLPLKGNAVGYISYEKGEIKAQSLPLSNVFFEKGTVSLEDDQNGLQTRRIGYVTRYINKESFYSKFPQHKGKELGMIGSIQTAFGNEEVHVFKYFDFNKKEYYEISGKTILVKKTGADFPCLMKTRAYYEALEEGNKSKIKLIKESLKPRNPFFLFSKNYQAGTIYTTAIAHRLYESNVNQTKIESGTTLGAINNAIGFQMMAVEKGKKDTVEDAFMDSIENIKVGKPPLIIMEVDQNTPPMVNKIENIQSQISTDEINLINAIAEQKTAASGISPTGAGANRYKNTQAVLADNQVEDDSVQSYIKTNIQVFKRMNEVIVNMMGEFHDTSFERFSIEGVQDEAIQEVGYFEYSELAQLIRFSELEVLMDDNSGAIPSSGARFQKAQAILAMAAQSNASPETVDYLLKQALQLAGIASNPSTNEQAMPQQAVQGQQGGQPISK